MHDLVDIGINLSHRQFGSDREALIARAQAAGVRRMLVTGTSVASTRAAIELARGMPGVLFATAGIHPHDASTASPEALGELAALARSPEVRAVGASRWGPRRPGPPRPFSASDPQSRKARLSPGVPFMSECMRVLLCALAAISAGMLCPGLAFPQEKEKKKPREDVAKEYEEKVVPILAKFCFKCHGPEKKKGDLDLSTIKTPEQILAGID